MQPLLIRVFLYYHRRVDSLGEVETRHFDLLLQLRLQTTEHEILRAYEAIGRHRGGASEEGIVAISAFLRGLGYLLEFSLVSPSSLSFVLIVVDCCLLGSCLALSEGDRVSHGCICSSAGV